MTPPHPAQRARGARRGLWVPALLSSLMLITVVGGVAVGHFYWTQLRTGMDRMDQRLASAQQQQKQVVADMAAARNKLIAQQRRIQETEERLHAREAALAAEQAALADERTRLKLAADARKILLQGTELRELMRRLDMATAALPDPGGIDGAGEAVSAIAAWIPDSGLVTGTDLSATIARRLNEARDALASADPASSLQLGERLQRLGAGAARLGATAPPGRMPPWDRGAQTARLIEQIETAAFALRRGDETLFRLALDTADAWLAAFYDERRNEVAAFSSELAALRRVPIRRDFRPAASALARLRAVLGALSVRELTGQETLAH